MRREPDFLRQSTKTHRCTPCKAPPPIACSMALEGGACLEIRFTQSRPRLARSETRKSGTRPRAPARSTGVCTRRRKKHRRHERRYWLATFILTLVIAFGAGASAIYAYKAATEAHEQAMQAHRQADIAQDALAASTRARLKVVSIDVAVTRGAGFAVSTQGGSTIFAPKSFGVVWFNF
jgi:hypothetical protein